MSNDHRVRIDKNQLSRACGYWQHTQFLQIKFNSSTEQVEHQQLLLRLQLAQTIPICSVILPTWNCRAVAIHWAEWPSQLAVDPLQLDGDRWNTGRDHRGSSLSVKRV